MILISQHITRSNSTKQRPKGKFKPDCDLVDEAHLLVDVLPRRVLEICGDGAPLDSKSPCPMGDGRSNTIVKQNFPHQQLSWEKIRPLKPRGEGTFDDEFTNPDQILKSVLFHTWLPWQHSPSSTVRKNSWRGNQTTRTQGPRPGGEFLGRQNITERSTKFS